MIGFVNHILSQVTYFIDSLGYVGVTLIVALEYACFPLPSEIILPFIGFAASKGRLAYLGVLFFSVFGGMLGSIMCYFIGKLGGVAILHTIEKKFPKSRKALLASNAWFDKYGRFSVFITRMLPLARTYISIPAGISKMNLLQFVVYSTLGIILWNTTLITLGYVLGDRWQDIVLLVENYNVIIGIAVVLLGGVHWVKHMRKRIKNKR